MPDQPEAPATPWPDWLADLTPDRRIGEILNAHAARVLGMTAQDAPVRLSYAEASGLLLRLLDEARQQAPAAPADLASLRERIDVALGESMDRCSRCKVCDAQLDAIMAVLAAESVPVPSADPKATLSLLRSQVTAALDRAFDGDGTDPADAVMAVVSPVVRGIWAEARSGPRTQAPVRPESLAAGRLTVAVAALRRLALDEPMTDLKPGNHAYLALEAEMTARREHAAGTLETIVQLSQVPEQPEPLTHFTTAGQSRLAADNFPACEAVHWAIVSPYVRQVTCDDCLTWLGSAVGNLTRALANAAATIERRDAELGEPDPEPPLPPGFFGRVELPGFRNYTGWITQDGADRIVSDWDGNVLAEYQPGPNCLTIHLPTPQKRPEPPKAITPGPQREEDDDPDDYAVHVPGCRREDCDGACSYGRPF